MIDGENEDSTVKIATLHGRLAHESVLVVCRSEIESSHLLNACFATLHGSN